MLSNHNSFSESTKLFAQDIMEALKLCLHSTIFSFNSVLYRQTLDTPMGSCISPVIANIFMESIERSAIDSFQEPPRVWIRYVDDIFCIIKTPVIDDFLHHINGISPSSKFTVKIEENRSLVFLDVRVSRSSDNTLWTNIYQRPTHTNRYLQFDSHHLMHQKLTVARSLYNRLETHASNPDNRNLPTQISIYNLILTMPFTKN